TTTLIGRMCKRGNAFSLPVLIARLNLIALIFNAHHQSESGASRRKTGSLISRIRLMIDQLAWMSPRDSAMPTPQSRSGMSQCVLCRPGGISGEPVPDPIPNSAVKLPSADGTKSQDLEEQVAARPAKDAKPPHDEPFPAAAAHAAAAFFVSPHAGARDLPAARS